MQDYKIKIPNPEISKQVLNKAAELGYKRYADNSSRISAGSLYLYESGIIGFM